MDYRRFIDQNHGQVEGSRTSSARLAYRLVPKSVAVSKVIAISRAVSSLHFPMRKCVLMKISVPRKANHCSFPYPVRLFSTEIKGTIGTYTYHRCECRDTDKNHQLSDYSKNGENVQRQQAAADGIGHHRIDQFLRAGR